MQYFIEKADKNKIIDLHPIFLDNWKVNKQKFNFEYDYHWNELGHKVASHALLKKLIFSENLNIKMK